MTPVRHPGFTSPSASSLCLRHTVFTRRVVLTHRTFGSARLVRLSALHAVVPPAFFEALCDISFGGVKVADIETRGKCVAAEPCQLTLGVIAGVFFDELGDRGKFLRGHGHFAVRDAPEIRRELLVADRLHALPCGIR